MRGRSSHAQRCSCDACQPGSELHVVTSLTESEYQALMAIAGVVVAWVLCELYALATGAPHFTVIFGGNG